MLSFHIQLRLLESISESSNVNHLPGLGRLRSYHSDWNYKIINLNTCDRKRFNMSLFYSCTLCSVTVAGCGHPFEEK